MSGWLIVGIVVLVLVLLAVGGAIAQRRRLEATTESFREHVEDANHDLAEAHAGDKGWDPAGLERSAERALAQQRPGVRVEHLTLVEVVDRPGTEDDRAVFRVYVAGEPELFLTLSRHDEDWVTESLVPQPVR